MAKCARCGDTEKRNPKGHTNAYYLKNREKIKAKLARQGKAVESYERRKRNSKRRRNSKGN